MSAHIQPTDVRLALPQDRTSIANLTTMLHGENGLFSISPTKVDRMLDRYFDRQGAIIGVIGPVGEVAGVIYLGLEQLSYTDDWSLVEQFNYVAPDHRRSTYARQLIAYAKQVSDQMHIPLMVGILSNKRTEAKVRLYEQLLDKAGVYFCYGLQYASGPGWK